MLKFSIQADMSYVDYHGAVKFIKKQFEADNLIKKIVFKMINNKSVEKALFGLLDFGPVNKKIRHTIGKIMKKKASVNGKIKKLDLKSKGKAMEINVKGKIEDLNEVLSFAAGKISIENKYLEAIIVSAVKSAEDNIDDKHKMALINGILERSNYELCQYLSDLMTKKLFEVKIESINIESEFSDDEDDDYDENDEDNEDGDEEFS